MVTAFQIILLIITILGFLCTIGDKEEDRRTKACAICIASILAFVGTLLLLK
ncbi:hypothetical protein [Sutcliffiella sp. FSL R7-0096]|uniref:hypothetical protein n=1 Tax=Sutcliffiella sp. FSL R7-0096 TaxID=2921670 RepID=UPI003159C3CA